MPTANREYKTSYELAQEMVQLYAPLTQDCVRLPLYTKPEMTLKLDASCHPDFAALMQSVCAKLDLTDRAQFSDEECQLFRYHRMHGLDKLYRKGLTGYDLLWSQTYHQERLVMLVYSLLNLLGEKLLALLGHDQYDTWFPWNDFQVECAKSFRGFQLYCRSLAQHVASDGRLFYSSANKPTVTIRGKRRIVAFSRHAIQRLAERTVLHPRSYADLGDIFAYVNHCQYFAPARLYPNQDAFSFFDVCSATHFSAEYARHILPTLAPDTNYAYRVGYCPVREDGGFWLAKTVLVPGHVGTPEYGLVRKASFDLGVQEQMLARCHEHSYQTTCATHDFSLLRWFHTHGVPQVITYTTPLFDNISLTNPRFNLVPASRGGTRLVYNKRSGTSLLYTPGAEESGLRDQAQPEEAPAA
jgi:hypothetical protein